MIRKWFVERSESDELLTLGEVVDDFVDPEDATVESDPW